MTDFKPYRIDLKDVRPGDGIHWKRSGLLAWILAHLIHWLKEPEWDMWDWHTSPVVSITNGLVTVVNAEFPKVKLTTFDIMAPPKEMRAYRVVPVSPPQWKIDKFIQDHVGRKYDFFGYIWNGTAKLLRPRFDIPRVIDLKDYCWEVQYDFYEAVCNWDPANGTDYDYMYPDICDLRRAYGEIPLKVRKL